MFLPLWVVQDGIHIQVRRLGTGFFFFWSFSGAAHAAYGGAQARGLIRAVPTG